MTRFARYAMTSPHQPRIALLIDADNAPADKVDEILTELSTLGEISIRRIYGNWTKPHLSGWQSKLLDYALRPMQQFDYAKGKNATDMAMTVDAMELLYTEHPQAFGIVSSDADFTPLVMHLRGKGAQVYGFGAAQTPKAFVNACSRFLYLESLGGPEEVPIVEEDTKIAAPSAEPELVSEVKQPEKPEIKAQEAPKNVVVGRTLTAQLRQDTRLMNLLRSAVQALQDDAGWVPVSALRTQIGNKASFDPRNYGYATLTKLLVAVEEFEFKNEGTSLVAVRAKKVACAARGSASREVVSWPVTQPRQPGKKLPPSIFALRSVLLQIAAARVSLVDILRAVPEMALGQTCSLAAVAGRLRERGLLLPTQSALRVLGQHPRAFVVDLKTMPQSVRYLMSWE
jgi:uncharacterized protein (TIGR00288 family)